MIDRIPPTLSNCSGRESNAEVVTAPSTQRRSSCKTFFSTAIYAQVQLSSVAQRRYYPATEQESRSSTVTKQELDRLQERLDGQRADILRTLISIQREGRGVRQDSPKTLASAR